MQSMASAITGCVGFVIVANYLIILLWVDNEVGQQQLFSMSEGESKRGSKLFRFCCYEVEHNEEEDLGHKKTKRKKNNPMVGVNIESKINFTSSLSNANVPIYKLLEDLYEDERDITEILPILKQKRVNPEISQELTERDDLEYYVPQLITYMVIECNLENTELNELIVRACMTHFYFAHAVFFYMESLSKNSEGISIPTVRTFIDQEFLPKMIIYSRRHLSGHELTRSMIGKEHEKMSDYVVWQEGEERDEEDQKAFNYGTLDYPYPPPDHPPPVTKVRLKNYHDEDLGFMETPRFWYDLIEIGEKICLYPPDKRIQGLRELIASDINQHLPSTVYIPFSTGTTRLYTILNVWEGRVFSTKQRAPFSIWLQIYREEQEQAKEFEITLEESEEEMGSKDKKKRISEEPFFKKIYQRLSKPFTVADGANTLRIKTFVNQKKNKINEALKKRQRFKSFYDKHDSEEGRNISLSDVYESKSETKSVKSLSENEDMGKVESGDEHENIEDDDVFSKPSELLIEEFKKKSIYRNLKSWKIIHMMVKTGDDLRQEQFAMQLIGKFQYIFQKENVECYLKPYEVISLGPDFGLIEMLNDITTLDSLFKKLSLKKMTLKDFFSVQFKSNKAQAKRNFMKSLAGYSLVTYFLQVKDRHNGNILLQRDGSILHIDFGFFLSNAPGKGVELEKKVPFKLLTQYVEVLGSLNSQMFFQFRRLFYKGFKAILKNKLAIISMVKMMYKSHGDMMSCFHRGEKAIEDLENRLHPATNNLENFCYELINNSLDNWRAKWYDKFQYFLQKIYY